MVTDPLRAAARTVVSGEARPRPLAEVASDATRGGVRDRVRDVYVRTMAQAARSERLITQLKERSDELSRRQAELCRSHKDLANKANALTGASLRRSRSLANMSHELRTPLNAMLLLARTLIDNPDGHLSDVEMQSASTIYRAGTDLLRIITDFLDLAKIEAGEMDVRPGVVQVAALVDYTESTFRPLAEGKELRLHVHVSPEVPAELFTDEHRLQQILRNLLSNAITFTPSGTISLQVSAAGQMRGEFPVVSFAVSDTGIGIPADLHEVIFEPFRQADSGTSRAYGGTGLGLSISRRIAGLLGGSLAVESTPGEGSTFTLLVPAFRRTGAPEGTRRCPPEGSGSPLPLPQPQPAVCGEDGERLARWRTGRAGRLPRNVTVLVIDDDIRNVFALAQVIGKLGSRVVYAESGQEGIEQARDHPETAIIVMDLTVPDIDGSQTIEAIRAMPGRAGLPIMALTAGPSPDDRDEPACQGASGCLPKPIDPDRLIDMMRRLLDNAQPPGALMTPSAGRS